MPLPGHCRSSEFTLIAPSKPASSAAWSANSEYRVVCGPPGVVAGPQSTVARAVAAGGLIGAQFELSWPADNSAISCASKFSVCGGGAVVVLVRRVGSRDWVVCNAVLVRVATGPVAESSRLTTHQMPRAPSATTNTAAAERSTINGFFDPPPGGPGGGAQPGGGGPGGSGVWNA